jgi:peptide/nickel transport system permease protein
VVGVPLGILAAVKQGKAVDSVVSIFAAFGQAVPSFWLGILLILYFGVQLGRLPIAGQSGFKSLIMPAISLSVVPLVSILRLTRSSVIQILHLDYVRTAEAKGLRRFTVLARHVLPNSMMPVITFTGILTGQLLGGAVITEQIFAWPGIGQLAIQSIEARDYAVVQAVTLLTSVIVVSLNLLVDFSYFLLDPRLRHAISSR